MHHKRLVPWNCRFCDSTALGVRSGKTPIVVIGHAEGANEDAEAKQIADLNRMKCEAEQRTEERAREAVANPRHLDEEFNTEKKSGSRLNSESVREQAI
jgi:hypothetical protein